MSSTLFTITRPQLQAERLLHDIQQQQQQGRFKQDFVCSLFPSITILARSFSDLEEQALIQKFATADYVVAISLNAVRCLSPKLVAALQSNPSAQMIAMGKSSAQAFADYQIQPSYIPPTATTTEQLLASEILATNQIKAKTIILLKGQGGRRLLSRHLQASGANLIEVVTYQRCCNHTPDQSAPWDLPYDNHIILVTSISCLNCFFKIAGKSRYNWLWDQNYIVPSRRVWQYSKRIGCKNVVNANGADNASTFAAMLQCGL